MDKSTTIVEMIDRIINIKDMTPEEIDSAEETFESELSEIFDGTPVEVVAALSYSVFLYVLERNPMEAIRLWNMLKKDIRETLVNAISNGLSEFLGGKVVINDAAISVQD